MTHQMALLPTLALVMFAGLHASASGMVLQKEERPAPSPPANESAKTKTATSPRPTTSMAPAYTEEARRARVQGNVVLEIVVHKDGTANVKRLVQGLGYGLDDSAKAAVEQARFAPATLDGEPVEVTIQVTFGFHLAGR